MARFLIDAQLPPALASRLRQSGHRAEHVFELGLEGAPDREIARAALEREAIVVTKDSDFVNLAHLGSGPPVLWLRIGNTINSVLWRRLEPLLPDLVSAFNAGETVIEVR